MIFLRMKLLLYKTSLKILLLLCHRILLKKLLTCLKEAEARTPRFLIRGHSNSVMSSDDISVDKFLFFFFTRLVITRISSRVALHCKK